MMRSGSAVPQFFQRLLIDFRLKPLFIDLSIGTVSDHVLERLVDLALELCARILRIDDAEELRREGFIIIDDRKMSLGVLRLDGLHGCLIADQCIDLPTDVEAYRQNRQLLTGMLSELGFEFVNPDGAFYLWVKALEDDAQAFSDQAKTHELLLVPSDSFGMKGWVRCSYCISPETIKNSRAAWEALKQDYAK